MAQVNALIRLLKTKWVSSADAFNSGITSYHRRLADFRQKHPMTEFETDWSMINARIINGKPHILKSRWREVETRWGKTRIKEWRLVAVK